MMRNDGDRRHSNHQLMKVLVYTTFTLAFSFFALLIFWMLYPYKVVETKPIPFEIVIPYAEDDKLHVVEQGNIFVYEFSYVKHTDVIPMVNRRFVDGLIFSEGLSKPTILEKGAGTARVEVKVPQTLPPGVYRLEIVRFYQMNPIRTIKIVSSTERFKVVESKKELEDECD